APCLEQERSDHGGQRSQCIAKKVQPGTAQAQVVTVRVPSGLRRTGLRLYGPAARRMMVLGLFVMMVGAMRVMVQGYRGSRGSGGGPARMAMSVERGELLHLDLVVTARMRCFDGRMNEPRGDRVHPERHDGHIEHDIRAGLAAPFAQIGDC